MGVYASSNRSDPSHMDRSKFTLAKFPFSKDGGVLMVISPSSPLLPFSPLFSFNYILQAFDYLDDYTTSEYFAVMSSSRNSYGYIYTSDFSVSIFFSLSLFQFFFLYLFVLNHYLFFSRAPRIFYL